jgi:pimeloyl-ACP methyl ester carboxylesterase
VSASAAPMQPIRDDEVEHRRVDVGPDADGRHLWLHVAFAGPADGTPVVLLHGFPEFWWSWRYQVGPLAAAGFRVIAPDLRGYGGSDRPPEIRAYRMENLVADVAGLVRALGHAKTHLVAHDWGGAIAWHVAATRPEVVDRLAILNAPHPAIFRRELGRLEQLQKSWYMFAFQVPGIPERRLQERATLVRTFRGWSRRREHFDDATIDRYVEAVRVSGAARAMVAYYRAGLRHLPGPVPRIDADTLVIWGMDDRALGPGLLVGLDAHVSRLRIERIPGASHWVAQDAPERVNALLLDFLR